MNRIDKKLKALKKEKRCALISYIVAGDPNLTTTKYLIKEISKNGADIIELGIPFSDPIADGPTIQEASIRALKNKVTIGKVLNLVKILRKEGLSTPIVFMTYFNIINSFGYEKFAKYANRCGVDGIIVPDLPPEESVILINPCRKFGIDTIFLIAPTSTPERIKLIAGKSRGFIYYVSLLGVTGARRQLPRSLKEKIVAIKRLVKKPLCVGFGISSTKHVKNLANFADGIIVGSAIVKKIEESLGKKDLVKRVSLFVKKLRGAIV